MVESRTNAKSRPWLHRHLVVAPAPFLQWGPFCVWSVATLSRPDQRRRKWDSFDPEPCSSSSFESAQCWNNQQCMHHTICSFHRYWQMANRLHRASRRHCMYFRSDRNRKDRNKSIHPKYFPSLGRSSIHRRRNHHHSNTCSINRSVSISRESQYQVFVPPMRSNNVHAFLNLDYLLF